MRISRSSAYALVAAHTAFAIMLWLRATIPSVRSATLSGSQIGRYSMFSEHIVSRTTAVLASSDGQQIAIPHQKFMWRNPFISTTHTEVEIGALDAFATYLAQLSELRAFATSRPNVQWHVFVGLEYRRNGGEVVRLSSIRNVGLR